jgi:hypothetical protein
LGPKNAGCFRKTYKNCQGKTLYVMKKMLRKIDPKNAANFKQAYKKFSRDKRSSLFYLFISDEKHYKIGINCFNI